MRDFHALIDDAGQRPFIGWDTTCDGRIAFHAPWDFAAIVAARARLAADLLDLGTGGGEWLGRLPARVLAPGGCFLTQQVASGGGDAHRLFGATPPAAKTWTLALASAQLTAAGLRIEQRAEGFETIAFADVGALAWYLKNLPGVFPGFSIDAARPQLERLHQRIGREGPLRLREPLFWLAARKPE